VQITQKQIDFIVKLIIQKEMPDDLKQKLELRLTGSDNPLSSFEASKTIDWLLKRPDKKGASGFSPSPRLTELEAKIPEGRYALRLATPDPSGNTIHFYSVDKPDEKSKWYGRTFVSLLVGNNDKFPVKAMHERERILAEIEKNPAEALLLYGREIGRCGHCGRTLTNDESRARGIGPVCLSQGGSRWGL